MKAVITAGGPIDGDFARAAGTELKALAPVRGRTMLLRTMDALRSIGVDRLAVVGPEPVRAACEGLVERVVPDSGSGSGNVLAALDAWPQDGEPLLYVTCDMPYVDETALRSFIDRVDSDALAMPLCEHAAYMTRFQGAPEAGITLNGVRVVNGGVFHIPGGAATRIRTFATQLFSARKAPWRMASIAGPALLLRFAFGRLSIERLQMRGRELLGIPVQGVRDCAPELSFDCDILADYRYANDHA